jgi:hypothetical protein
MNYTARHDITVGGACMARAGDLIHEAHVTGPDAWLKLGEDVDPVTGADVPEPARSASAAAWEAFLLSRGFGADELGAMGRDQMIAAWDKSQAPPEPVPAAPRGRARAASSEPGAAGESEGTS